MRRCIALLRLAYFSLHTLYKLNMEIITVIHTRLASSHPIEYYLRGTYYHILGVIVRAVSWT